MYNETQLDHFLNPRHVGDLPGANGVGTIGDPSCGNYLRVFIEVEGEVITDLENIGQCKDGVLIEGEEKTDDVLNWCDVAFVTGSTLVNGTIDKYMGLKTPTIFYGMTIAGAAALLGLTRFYPESYPSQ